MNRLAVLLTGIAFAAPVFGQSSTVSTIRIFTDPPGARFYVDGQVYTSAQVFTWPTGSRHVVEFPLFNNAIGTVAPYQLSLDGSVRYRFEGWEDNAVLLNPDKSPVQVVIAHPAITSLRARVTPLYRVQLRFTNTSAYTDTCTGAPGNPDTTSQIRTGLVYINQDCFTGNVDLFLPADNYKLNAFPYPGFVFLGWSINGGNPLPYLLALNVRGPVALSPSFVPGKRVQFLTDPPGLKVLIDRTETPTSSSLVMDRPVLGQPDAVQYCDPDFLRLPPGAPATFPPLCYGEFDFIPGSTHVISGVSPQLDSTGKPWVFTGWSNGLGENALYTVGPAGGKEVLTAKFKRGVTVTFMTSPPGLRLNVNGRENWPAYNFIVPAGSQQKVSALLAQTDRQGRRWVFKRWSNGGDANQTIQVPEDSEGIALTAIYEVLPQVTLQTNPPGVAILVDGRDCATPCVLDREAGSEVAVTVPQRVGFGDDLRLELAAWSDGEGATRKVVFNTDTQVLTANYEYFYRLQLVGDPADGINFRTEPASPDRFYPAETVVSVQAEAKPGYKFVRWGGDLDGTSPTATVLMSTARGVIAYLQKIPFIPPAGIRNAAGETPDPAVAPGSMIAIFGENLAREFEMGRTNPLAQTIGGVTVQVRDRFLPLIFVSEKQINALLPSDFPEGEHELIIRRSGEPDVKGKFTVARHGPGLFSRATDNGVNLAVANHEDGQPVATENPVRPGEIITFYGTGFGPTDRRWVDGFDLPMQGEFKLVDPVEVRSEDYAFETVWAGLAPGTTGMVAVKVRIPQGLPPGALMDVRAIIGGKSSNLVKLPVQ